MKGKKVFRLNKLFYIVTAAAVCFIAAVFIIFSVADKSSLTLFMSADAGGALVFADGDNTGKIVPGDGIASVRYNSDKTFCAVLMSDKTGYSLFSVKENSVRKIAENCTDDFVCSADGSNVVYLNTAGGLFSGTKMIDESASSFAVSPDCSAVAYTRVTQDKNELYLYSKGKTVLLGENYKPLAVSADRENIYVLSQDNSLYMLGDDGNVISKICSAVQPDSVRFSSDAGSVVFSDGEYTYVSVGGTGRVRLVHGNAAPVRENDNEVLLNSEGNAYLYDTESMGGLFYFTQSPDGTFSVYYVDDEYSGKAAAQSVSKFFVTGDKTMAYLDAQGRIYKYNNGDTELSVSGALDFLATEGNRYIYYMTSAGSIYSSKGNNAQLLAEGAVKMYLNREGKLYIIMSDRRLYSISGTKKSDAIAEKVSFCVCTDSADFCGAGYNTDTGTYSLHVSTDGRNFDLIAENVLRQ